jgi:thiol-disulfide isomerase/thioredoxin
LEASRSFGKSALKVLLGLVFIVSAVLKIVGVDRFEIYVYSYHFFSLNFSFIVARLAIILELALGLGLISHTLHKLYWWGSMAMLAGYTLLLIYALVIGRTDSCHCFGDFLQLDPKQSLIKNGVLMLLFLWIFKMKSWTTPFRWIILCLIVIASAVGVFLASPPDNMISDSDPEQNLQMEYFDEMLDTAPLDTLHLREGKQVVCFFSTACEYCKVAAQKLSLMQRFYGFPDESITYLFIGNEESVARFYEQSESARYRDVIYPEVPLLLKAVSGNLPVVVFMDDGVVVREYGLRNMDEAEIKKFMAF